MLYQLSHVRVAWRTLTDGPEPSKQGGPAACRRSVVPDRFPQVSGPSGPARRWRAAPAARRRGRAARSPCPTGRAPRSGAGTPRRSRATARTAPRPRARAGAGRGRRSRRAPARAGRRRRRRGPSSPAWSSSRLSSQAMPPSSRSTTPFSSPTSPKAMRTANGSARVVAEQRRYLGPRLRTDQLKRDGGGVPGGPSARHVRSTTVGSRSDVALHFLHIRHTRHTDGSVVAPCMPDRGRPDEPQERGRCERCV